MPYKKMYNKQLGKAGEDFACDYLKKSGYTIIERNWHYSKNAEIDIIAKDNKTLVFVEVKTRSNLNCGHPLESISQSKFNKIRLAATAYIAQIRTKYTMFRIDVVSITGSDNFQIEHLKNVSL